MSSLPWQIFDLSPDDPAQYRSLAEAEWSTLRGKRNRIAIGTPVCKRETAGKGGLLSTEEARAYAEHDFYRLSLSLTLLPDARCQFRSADFLMNLDGEPGRERAPLFVRLQPREVTSKAAVKLTSSDSAKLAVKDSVFKLVDSELGGSAAQEVQFERLDVQLASFGERTRSAGWRFTLTESKPIPLSSPDLEAVAAVPRGQQGRIRFRVAAQIEVETAVDRFLTRLFLRNQRPGASADYQFP